MTQDERDKIIAAADALRTFNGHDSDANLRFRYGAEWWNAITKIERELRELADEVTKLESNLLRKRVWKNNVSGWMIWGAIILFVLVLALRMKGG